MNCHITAFLTAFLLDLLVGDPYWMPHPVRWMGHFIACYDRRFFSGGGTQRSRRFKGAMLCVTLLLTVALITALLTLGAYLLHPLCGIAVETVLCCYTFAAKSLRTESMKVYRALKSGDLAASRKAVSMIVGRDTDGLDEAGVTKAAVETVAENTSDGVIAPMLFCALGGPVLAMLYKAVNTMDSMVGYHNERYEDYGYCAAKLDDLVNFIPARLSARLMILAAALLGRDYDAKAACRIFKRDRFNHKSPNSAQTESVCAGALGIRLAGDASYFGMIVKKPYIGDERRKPEPEDIRRANRLMLTAALLWTLICSGALYGILLLTEI